VFNKSIHSAYSQTNIVPNPSFEDYTNCPNDWAQAANANGWYEFSSADYYNECGVPDSFGIPSNTIGTQYAASGSAYAGIVAYSNATHGSEVIGTNLITPLIIGQKYFVSFKAVLKYNNPWNICCASNNLGVRFAKNSNCPPVDNFCHVNTQQVITDTSNWTRVFGSFIADSVYTNLCIGNFFYVSNTSATIVNPGATNTYSYYFIDDVCVSTDSGYASNYFYTNIQEISLETYVQLYPNPVKDFLSISNKYSHPIEFNLYNVLGQKIKTVEISPYSKASIDLTFLNSGLYTISIASFSNIQTKKIIKQ
jgi:hypothetical protein